MKTPPIGTNCCDARWGGLRTAHCSACHYTFSSISAFDKHRTGSHALGQRTCLNPTAVGLVLSTRDYPCWGAPADESREFGEAS